MFILCWVSVFSEYYELWGLWNPSDPKPRHTHDRWSNSGGDGALHNVPARLREGKHVGKQSSVRKSKHLTYSRAVSLSSGLLRHQSAVSRYVKTFDLPPRPDRYCRSSLHSDPHMSVKTLVLQLTHCQYIVVIIQLFCNACLHLYGFLWLLILSRSIDTTNAVLANLVLNINLCLKKHYCIEVKTCRN